MRYEVFAIRDSAIEEYSRPFFARTVPEGLRFFSDMLSDPQSDFARHPQDYCLFHIGSYEGNTGELIPLPAPHSLGVAVDLMPSQPTSITEAMNGSRS